MSKVGGVFVVVSNEDGRVFAEQISNALGHEKTEVVVGSPVDAAKYLEQTGFTPLYLVIDIGDRGFDVMPELDVVAEYCSENARVVVMGTINDVTFYRDLRQRGVVEYFTKPVKISDVRRALIYDAVEGGAGGKSEVISFFSAGSGDGSSTVALNTAFAIASTFRKSVVLVDMDFQFGLLGRNLDLTAPFGIKELFEHPERSIDSTLIDRMLVDYTENLKVISVPSDLRFYPPIKSEMVRDLLYTLRQRFDYVIVDLPHLWTQWSRAVIYDSNKTFIVGQLWLRSLTHTTRLLGAFKESGIDVNRVSIIINRSGARFTEAVSDRDFERATARKIDHFINNDIKTVVSAENQGKTVMEIGVSTLERQFREVATLIVAPNTLYVNTTASSAKSSDGQKSQGLFSRFKAK